MSDPILKRLEAVERNIIPSGELELYIQRKFTEAVTEIRNINKAEIRQMIHQEMISVLDERLERAIEKGTRATLERLGIDPNEGSEMRADFVFTRNQRKTHEKLSVYMKTAIIGMAITSAASAIILGCLEKIKGVLHG